MQVVGIVVFALGILVSVCLHEAGHMFTAKAFGMKVTRYFVGFGPTLWSFRRGETEYGIKAIPAGGFVKITGMTPQEEEAELAADREAAMAGGGSGPAPTAGGGGELVGGPVGDPRAMWRFPVWKRTIVMSAGSAAHFVLGLILLWVVFAFFSVPDSAALQSAPVQVDTVASCIASTWQFDKATQQEKACVPGVDPTSAASTIGLKPGDTIIAVNGTRIAGWDNLSTAIRGDGGRSITITYVRAGVTNTVPVTLPVAQRIKLSVLNDPSRTAESITPADLENVGVLGISPVYPMTKAGPVGAFAKAGNTGATLFSETFSAMGHFPERFPKLFDALTGHPRDPGTPISVVGASRIGGELFSQGQIATFLLVLASLNFFVGIFNLVPLLPLDGGHIAVAWFERARSWLYARLGRRDPGRVDYAKLMPITYVVILLFGSLTVLTVAADIVNPISIVK
jgi:membrane-associated protease RseP (regulator of RpoE activity)